MVLPLIAQYAVSMITSSEEGKVSLHLIHTYSTAGGIMEPVDAGEYWFIPAKDSGIWLEYVKEGEQFEFANPFVTDSVFQVQDFLHAAMNWAKKRVTTHA